MDFDKTSDNNFSSRLIGQIAKSLTVGQDVLLGDMKIVNFLLGKSFVLFKRLERNKTMLRYIKQKLEAEVIVIDYIDDFPVALPTAGSVPLMTINTSSTTTTTNTAAASSSRGGAIILSTVPNTPSRSTTARDLQSAPPVVAAAAPPPPLTTISLTGSPDMIQK